jgi:Raf kinase inhibitor-like YbhB/YbcL family protein
MRLERTRPPDPFDHLPVLPEFAVTSEDFADEDTLPMAHVYHGAGGGNRSPQLSWSGFPAQTRSFAVTCYDPDAPTGCGWWHWLVVGLPTDITSLPAGAGDADGALLPATAVQLRNDYGTSDYGGAAPPSGDHYHRYLFTVYALDTDDLGLSAQTSAAVASFTINAHALARGHLRATFAH